MEFFKKKKNILNKILKSCFQFFCSLKLAFFIFIIFIILLSIGTYVESRYDAETAKAWIYDSYFLYSLFLLLILNLFSVMMSRWPWKKRHISFLFAHAGIIILVIGALVTRKYGLDGSVYLPIGEKTKFVSIPQKELAIFSSFNGESYTLLYHDKVNFLNSPPQKKPIVFSLSENKKLKITHYHHFALQKQNIVTSKSPTAGKALKFQIWNHQVNEVQWIFLNPRKSSRKTNQNQVKTQNSSKKSSSNYKQNKEDKTKESKGNFESIQMGPAQVILNNDPIAHFKTNRNRITQNTIVFHVHHLNAPQTPSLPLNLPQPEQKKKNKNFKKKAALFQKQDTKDKRKKKIFYEIYKMESNTNQTKSNRKPNRSNRKKRGKKLNKDEKPKFKVTQSGWVSEGDQIQTGWMDLKLRILRFLKKAKVQFEYEVLDRKTDESIPFIRLSFDNKESYSLGLNSFLRIFTEKEVYVVSFANQKINLGFPIHLKKFNIKYYPGTKKAMSYESHVLVDGKSHIISMNQPLKYKGFTFYQSSFQENEKKEVLASILSVNKDPGRFIKYLGGLILSIGTLILFYFRSHFNKTKAKKRNKKK